MGNRFTILAVALVSLLLGLASGSLVPKRAVTPVPFAHDEEKAGPGKKIFVIGTDPHLDSPVAFTSFDDGVLGGKWVFTFRDPAASQRASKAVRAAITAEYNRALDRPSWR